MYRQITVDERYTLGLLRQLGYPVATIARSPMTRSTPFSKPPLLAMLCCVTPAIVVACGRSSATAPVNCKTSVAGGTSHAAGALTLTGQFYAQKR